MAERHEVGFVLSPGAGLGSWAWDRVIPELHAPALPLPIRDVAWQASAAA